MARDAVPQAQELPQERFLDRAEQRHVRAILAAGQYGAERDQQQFMQIMAGIILPRVNDLGKAGDEFFHGRASTLNPRLESSHASPSNPRLQPPAPYAIALGAKLILLPLAVYALGTWVFGLPPLWICVATIFAAMPTGIKAYLFATRYQVGAAATSSRHRSVHGSVCAD